MSPNKKDRISDITKWQMAALAAHYCSSKVSGHELHLRSAMSSVFLIFAHVWSFFFFFWKITIAVSLLEVQECAALCHTADRTHSLIMCNNVASLFLLRQGEKQAALSTCGQRLSLVGSKCVSNNMSASIIYGFVYAWPLCVYVSVSKAVGVCNVSLYVWLGPTCGHRSAELSENWLALYCLASRLCN